MITILGSVDSQGYALPMVSAYPTDVNLAQLLAWDVAQQALAYVPYTGNSSGDFGVGRDLSVARDAAVVRNLDVNGTLDIAGASTLTGAVAMPGGINGSLGVTGAVNVGTTYSVAGTQIAGTRKTGWTVMTGTASRATKATGTVTLAELAGIVMALEQDLISHGLIGT